MCTRSAFTILGSKRHDAPVLLNIYGFMDLYRASQAARSAGWMEEVRWHQQSVSVENLHGNKSYNLSPVCTLDWLRAITPTKKTFFPLLLLFLLSPPCLLSSSRPCVKLILWTFLKIFVYFRFSSKNAGSLSFFSFFSPIFFKYGTRERRLPSKWNSCQEFPMSQCAFSPFVLPDPLPSPNPSCREKARRRWTKALSPLSSRWDPHRCWVMGEREGGGPREEVGGEERKNGGLNRGKLPSFWQAAEGRGEVGPRII